MSDNVRRIIPSLYIHVPFLSFSFLFQVSAYPKGTIWLWFVDICCMQSMPKESGVIFYLFCQAGGSGGKSSEEMVLELSADQESGILSFSAFFWLVSGPGLGKSFWISRAWILLVSLTTFLCSSADSWRSVPRTMIARSRLPDKLLTDNAHADSFAMSEDWTVYASWKAAVTSATRASAGGTAVQDIFT